MVAYMKCDDIQGDATSTGHENWIELRYAKFHLRTPVKTKVGDTKDRVHGRPVVGEMEILKTTDSSSVKLMNHLLNSTVIPKVIIDVCHTSNELNPHEQFELSNVILSNYSEMQYPESSRRLEVIRLNFTKLERTHTKYGSDGRAQSPQRAGYDLETGKSC